MALTISSTSYGYHVTGDTSGTIFAGKLRIAGFIFTPVNAGTDAVRITDGKGNLIWAAVGTTAYDSIDLSTDLVVDGLAIGAMTHATDNLVVLVE